MRISMRSQQRHTWARSTAQWEEEEGDTTATSRNITMAEATTTIRNAIYILIVATLLGVVCYLQLSQNYFVKSYKAILQTGQNVEVPPQGTLQSVALACF